MKLTSEMIWSLKYLRDGGTGRLRGSTRVALVRRGLIVDTPRDFHKSHAITEAGLAALKETA